MVLKLSYLNNMSTTFGVKIDKHRTVEVAFRGNDGDVRWLDDLAELLPDDLVVIPLDNTAQGIHNIGDIKKEIHSQVYE